MRTAIINRRARRVSLPLALALAAFGILAAIPSGVSAGDPSAGTVRPPSAFPLLSPGNQIIARALHEAQMHSSTAPTGHWSLERIARMSAGGRDWGGVFTHMHQAGLFAVDGLSEVVFTYQEPRTLRAADSAVEQNSPSRVTTSSSETGKPNGGEAVPGATDSLGVDALPVGYEGEKATGYPTGGGGDISGGHGYDRGR